METIRGICGAPGLSRGTAVALQTRLPELTPCKAEDAAAELARFKAAQSACARRLTRLYDTTAAAAGEDEAEIFLAHRSILNDEEFFAPALRRVEAEGLCVEYTVQQECRAVEAELAAQENAYLRERASDIRNVCDMLIAELLGLPEGSDDLLRGVEDAIVVAEELSPADTVRLDRRRLRGFVTERGGPTGHVAILAKGLGIPALVAAGGACRAVQGGEALLLDATGGSLVVEPDEATLTAFVQRLTAEHLRHARYAAAATSPATTRDGRPVAVCINTGDAASREAFNPEGCDGVGLFRSEFLFLGRTAAPGEEEQYAAYSDIVRRAAGRPVVIRTLDAGGDKELPYLGLPREDNPFLGQRAIRISLEKPALFCTQLRAILRAGAEGEVRILLPMVAVAGELRLARTLLDEVRRELREAGTPHAARAALGVMIETPAAALCADQLAAEADFFSLGTNDLTQYMLAADRLNERVQALYDCAQPAVLRAAAAMAREAAKAGRPWGVCGEAASDEDLVPFWLALGASELSVAPALVGRVKQLVRRSRGAVPQHEMDALLRRSAPHEIRGVLRGWLEEEA